MSKRNIFDTSIFEQSFKDVKELEEYEDKFKTCLMKKVKCPVDDCPNSYRKQSSFRTHVRTKHADLYNNDLRSDNVQVQLLLEQEHSEPQNQLQNFDENQNVSLSPLIDHSTVSEDGPNQIDDICVLEAMVVDIFDPAQLLNIKPVHNSTFLKNIQNNFSIKCQTKAYEIFDEIIVFRYGHMLPESTFATIASGLLVKALSLFSDELSVQTNLIIREIIRFAERLNLQKTYLRSLGGLIEPVQKSIGEISYQYVSIKEVAQMALNKSIIEEILREQSRKYPENLREYSSELTCEFTRWCVINGTARIQVYSDEFSVVNPIGHSKQNQNYLVVYCSFTNIPYKDRLKRGDLFLLLIVNHKNIDYEILNEILDQLNQDLQDLVDNGIEKPCLDGSIKIPCTLSSFVGDAKSAYQFTGYPDNFYQGYRCRVCGADHDEIQHGILNRPLFGSQDDVSEYWRLVDQAEGIYLPVDDETRQKFGLLRTFKFSSQSESNPINPWNVCPMDICHDVLEGAMPKIGSVILVGLTERFLRNKDEMVSLFGDKQFYDAPLSVRSVTGGFALDGDMIQRAELFIRMEQIFLEDLPLVSGVPASQVFRSRPFCLYLAVKDISIISFKTTITEDDLVKLTKSIEIMFRLVKEIDPDCSVTPKMHHISHYPQLIRKFGPLIYFSSLPFERKHQFFKQWARVMHNMMNPALSLAVRHQCYQAVTFKANEYNECDFDFNSKLVDDPEMSSFPPETAEYLHQPIPCKLDKDVIRRIGTSNLWIEITSFWKLEKEIYVGGPVYEKKSDTEFGFPILEDKFDLQYIRYNELYHVNDFISNLNDNKILISAII